MKAKRYHYEDISNFMTNRLIPAGYDCVHTREGSLGIGNYICVPPDENKYAFIVREEYLNSQSSYHTMMKVHMPLPKKYQKELEEYYTNNVL